MKESFDLRTAKATHKGFTCPYHGDAQCDCQIMVLLVYGKPDSPITLIIQSQDGRTNLSMVSPECCKEEYELANEIMETLTVH